VIRASRRPGCRDPEIFSDKPLAVFLRVCSERAASLTEKFMTVNISEMLFGCPFLLPTKDVR